jgi:hypothetical protein
VIAHLGGEAFMEHALTGATWFWLFIPMLALVAISIITNFTERE